MLYIQQYEATERLYAGDLCDNIGLFPFLEFLIYLSRLDFLSELP